MVHRVIDEIITEIKNAFPEVKEARYYKGEFEPDGEWNPIFPAVLLNCPVISPVTESQRGWLRGAVKINCYVAFKLDEQRSFFTRFLPFITSLKPDNEHLRAVTCMLHGYFSGVEVYRVELECERQLQE